MRWGRVKEKLAEAAEALDNLTTPRIKGRVELHAETIHVDGGQILYYYVPLHIRHLGASRMVPICHECMMFELYEEGGLGPAKYGEDEESGMPKTRYGNTIHPVFSWDEWVVCGKCTLCDSWIGLDEGRE